MVFVDSHNGAGGAETLEHTVRPATMAMLQRLHDLQFQIDVDLERNSFKSVVPWFFFLLC